MQKCFCSINNSRFTYKCEFFLIVVFPMLNIRTLFFARTVLKNSIHLRIIICLLVYNLKLSISLLFFNK